MTYEAQKIGTVEGLGDIYRVAAPLDKQLRAFADKGIHTLAAPDEVAQIRLAGVSKDYSRTSMAPIALKGKKTILVRDSILMNPLMAPVAVRAYASKRHFETNRDVYEAAEALAKSQESMAPEDRSALIVSQRGCFILTPEMPESQFIFRKQTEPYFDEFTKQTKPYFDRFTKGTIEFENLPEDSNSQVIFNYLWFGHYRVLHCGWLGLDKDEAAYGVLRTAEGTSQRISGAEVSISALSLAEVLEFSRRYVSEAARDEYESGIRSIFFKK